MAANITTTYYILKDDKHIYDINNCIVCKWKTLTGCVIVQLPDNKHYLAHNDAALFSRILVNIKWDIMQLYITLLNIVSQRTDIENGTFKKYIDNEYLRYVIVGDHIYDENTLTRAIKHKYTNDIPNLNNIPTYHPDIKNNIERELYDTKLDDIVYSMLEKAKEPIPLDIVISNAIEQLNTGVVRAMQTPKQVVMDSVNNNFSGLTRLTVGGLVGPNNVYPENLSRIPPGYNYPNKQVCPQGLSGHDESIFHMLTGIDCFLNAIHAKSNSSITQLVSYMKDSRQSPTGEINNIVNTAVNELNELLKSTEPLNSITKEIETIRTNLKITDPRYIIREGVITNYADIKGIPELLAYVTNGTYTDVKNSLEYKNNTCYDIIGDDISTSACCIYIIHSQLYNVCADIQDRT